MKLLEAVLLALCVATLVLLEEVVGVVLLEGAHYTANLRRGTNLLWLWLSYAAVFLPFALVAWLAGRALPGGGRSGRTATLLVVLASLGLPLVATPIALRHALREAFLQPAPLLVAAAVAALAVAALGWGIRRGDPRVADGAVLACVLGHAAVAVLNLFLTHEARAQLFRAETQAHIAAGIGIGWVLSLPLLLSMRGATSRVVAKPLALAWGALAALLLAVVAGPAVARYARSGVSVADPSRPSALLIVVDTLRADHVAGFGADAEATPALASLVRDGISFRNTWAPAPWTLPSVASLLTSTYPSEHRAGRRQASWRSREAMGESIATLAEVLEARGYWTGAALTNPTLSPVYGIHRGFQHWENLVDFRSYHPIVSALRARGIVLWREYLPAEIQTPRVRALLDRARHSGQPFFLLAHYLDPHRPYGPPGTRPRGGGWGSRWPRHGHDELAHNELRAILRELYRLEVAHVDRYIGSLLSEIREAGLYDDLLIVLTADHGEDLLEERADERVGSHDHGHTLYEELLQVPLVVKLPGNAGAGTVRTDTASLIDVAPTILGVLDIEAPSSFRGRDLLETPAGSQPIVFAESILYGPEQKAALRGRDKVILESLPADPDAAKAYDLRADPDERHPAPLAADRSFAELYEALETFAESGMAAHADRAAVGVDPLLRERLEALGYTE